MTSDYYPMNTNHMMPTKGHGEEAAATCLIVIPFSELGHGMPLI